MGKVFLPPRSRKSVEVLEALTWYWAVIAAALALEHKKGVSLDLAKNAFCDLLHFLRSKVKGGIFPCEAGQGTSRGSLGVRNAWDGA